MMRKLAVLVLFLGVPLIISGCVVDFKNDKGILCNSPYIRFSDGCCLDQNENKICDNDENLGAKEITGNIESEELKECYFYSEIFGGWESMRILCKTVQDCVDIIVLSGGDTPKMNEIKCEITSFKKLSNKDGSYLSCNTDEDCLLQLHQVSSLSEVLPSDLTEKEKEIFKKMFETIKCKDNFCHATEGVLNSISRSYTKKIIHEETEEDSDTSVICATKVNFDITNACIDGDDVKITVSNNADKDIDGFKVKLYESAVNIETDAYLNKLSSFDIKTYTSTPITMSTFDIKIVELIPLITHEGNSITCSENMARFGSLDLNNLPLC